VLTAIISGSGFDSIGDFEIEGRIDGEEVEF
jgi:hypothetical protein